MDYQRPLHSSDSSTVQRVIDFLPAVPIISWLPKYRIREWLANDLIAGLTVALMLLPQCLAYAVLAGLPVRYGLLASYIAPIVYPFFGTSRELSMGPSAIISLVVSRALVAEPASDGPALAFALSFYAGILQVLFGLLRLGFTVEILSIPASSGFISAAALTIVVSQLKSFFHTAGSNRSFALSVKHSFEHIRSSVNAYYPDLILGLSTVAVLFLMHLQAPGKDAFKEAMAPGSSTPRSTQLWMRLRRTLAATRYAIVVTLATVISYVIFQSNYKWQVGGKPKLCTESTPCSPFTLVGHMQAGFKNVAAAPTLGAHSLSALAGNIPLVAIVSFIETIAVCKALAADGQSTFNPSQELIALGVSNIIGSFLSAFPISVSPPRTAINKQSGVKTPLGGLVAAILVIITIQFATSLLFWIPKAALAAVIVVAAVSMFQLQTFLHLLRCSRLDAAVMTVGFVACVLLDIGFGIAVAIAAAILAFIYQSARIPLRPELLPDGLLSLRVGSQLLFPVIGELRRSIRQAVVDHDDVRGIALNLAAVTVVDATAAIGLGDLVVELRNGIPGYRVGADGSTGRIKVAFVGLEEAVRDRLVAASPKLKPVPSEDSLRDAVAALLAPDSSEYSYVYESDSGGGKGSDSQSERAGRRPRSTSRSTESLGALPIGSTRDSSSGSDQPWVRRSNGRRR